MCGVMEGLAIFGAVTSLVGGQQQAQNVSNAAEENVIAQYEQNDVKAEQIIDSTSVDMAERHKQAMIDQAESRAIAGESGALGYSTDRMMADSYMQLGQDIMSMEQNKSNQLAQIDVDNKSIRARGQSQANTAYNQVPSAVGTGLQIAGTVAQANQTTEAKTTG